MSKTSAYPAKTVYHEEDLLDISNTNDNGSTYNESQKSTLVAFKDHLATRFHQNGGNAYGGASSIGTTDNQAHQIKTNDVVRATYESGGNIKHENGTLLGDSSINANIDDVYIKVGKLPDSTASAGDTGLFLFTGLNDVDILSVQVMMRGVDGDWYQPEHTLTANSLYHYSLVGNATNSTVRIDVPGGSTNFSNSLIRVIITYL